MMKLLNKFKRLNRKKKISIVIGFIAALILVFIALAANFGWFDKQEASDSAPAQKFYSQLTGQEISEKLSDRPILGVMVENSQSARPQTGLDSAGIIFEAVTEGGITRFLALYQDDMPKEIGPVRSVRPHFVGWLYGFDASVAHVGGSFRGLELVDTLNAKTLSQFKYPGPYHRISDRAAPHNMYASMAGLRALQAELKHHKSNFSDIPRSDDSPAQAPDAKKIIVDFSGPDFIAEFRYDPATNSYKRSVAGVPQIDAATDKQITVKNLVVIQVKGTDSNTIKTLGGGTAWLFKDGTFQKIRWEKDSNGERIKFVDETGNEVPLNRGDTWISALTGNRKPQF